MWWTTYQFDSVVVKFGLHIESELMETDRDGKLINTLESLLGTKKMRSGHRAGEQQGIDTVYADEIEEEAVSEGV